MHYYQFNIGDYASHTRNLSLLEDLAYRRLLDEYYLHERALNANVSLVARHIGMQGHEAEVQFVLETFFELSEVGWVNNRADQEIHHFRAKIEQASRAGKASAARRLNNGSTDVQLTNNQQPITNNHIEEQQEKPASKEKKRGTRLSEDWQPDEKLIQFAKTKRPDLNLNDTVRMFKNYWVAKTKDATKLDWNLTFENWVMNQKASYTKQTAQPTASAYGDRASL